MTSIFPGTCSINLDVARMRFSVFMSIIIILFSQSVKDRF
nr:MAG TPA: hypothetical protein [Bacteriophage sp.]DAR47908.1 MAG TPA: hypothetical protein [Bacteriophage sp.]